MKRFWIFITTFSLAEWIGRHPASAGLLMLLGIGGGIVGGNLITPSITPQPAAYFNQSNQQLTNNALKPNGGTTGAFLQPTDAAGSFAVLFDATVDSALGGSAAENLFGGLTLTGNQVPGQSSFLFQRNVAGQTGTFLWNAASAATNVSVNASGTMSGYNTGFYPFTASGNCIRNPSGVWQGGGASIQITDPGFGCPLTPTVSVPSIPNAGAQQTGVTATCASGGAGMLVTTNVPVAPGLTAGQTYNLSGFTTSPANALNTPTWTAVSVTGSGPYSIVGTAAGSCPTISSTGALGSGTGASIAFPTISTTNPYQFGGTGITTRSGQHICGALIENGNNSAFPGAAALAIVDDQGNALPGAPAVVPFLNQGTANFRGYITAGTQSASSPALTVTAMNAYTISGAAFTGGRATFVTSTSPGFVPGSEFTVSGVSSTGPGSYNHTYVAVAGTSGTTIVANPLSGPAGTPQSISSPGTYSSGGTMVSVILPGMKILGSDVINGNSANISPYGTFGGTGTGGVGAYGLTANPTTTTTFTVSSAAGLAITVTGTPAQPIVVGTTFVLNSNTYVIASLGTGTGGAGTYNVASGSPASGTATMTGSIGSSGAPVTLFAFPGYFYTAAASSNPAGEVVTDRTGVSMGDFTGQIGSSVTNVIASVKAGWGGSIGNVAMLYGPMPMAASGAPDMTKLANLCKKTTTLPAFAAANGMTVHSFYPLNDIGIYGDASVAQISGYIAATAGATSGVLNLVGSPTTGALTGSGSATLSGPGIPGCPAACPAATLGAGPTYTVTWGSGIGQNVGSGGSPVAMAAGAYKPAMPIQSVTFKGYVDGSPATTLHVTSFDDGVSHSGFASFTGVLGTSFTGSIASNTLTVTAPTTGAAVLGVGTTVCPPVSNSKRIHLRKRDRFGNRSWPQWNLHNRRFSADGQFASDVRRRHSPWPGDIASNGEPNRHDRPVYGGDGRWCESHGPTVAHHGRFRLGLDGQRQLLSVDRRETDDRYAELDRSRRIHSEREYGWLGAIAEPRQGSRLSGGMRDHRRHERRPWLLYDLDSGEWRGRFVRITGDLRGDNDHRWRRDCAGARAHHPRPGAECNLPYRPQHAKLLVFRLVLRDGDAASVWNL